jgi:hypothetical protein
MSVFSFHFLTEEDRLALTFSGQEKIPAVLLTRRLVKMLGGYLRSYVEKYTSLPETVTTEDKDDMFQFMHMNQLEENPPSWDSKGQKRKEKAKELQSAQLGTKIDIQYTEQKIRLKIFNQNKHLVSLTLGWREIHSFLYSLAEMSRKADWNLEGTFEWSGRSYTVKDQYGQRQ